MRRFITTAILVLMPAIAAAQPVQLTDEQMDSVTAGKSIVRLDPELIGLRDSWLNGKGKEIWLPSMVGTTPSGDQELITRNPAQWFNGNQTPVPKNEVPRGNGK